MFEALPYQNDYLAQVPEDIREWVPEASLVYLVLDAAQVMNHQRPRGGMIMTGAPNPTLLTLLTFCYATARYGSRELELLCGTDETIRYLCVRGRPDWNTLRNFRRRNRHILHQALVELLLLSWKVKEFGFSEQDLVQGTHALTCLDQRLESELRTALTIEAGCRIDRAMQLDSIALDE